jgi:putrescine transport system ATP-binding protein
MPNLTEEGWMTTGMSALPARDTKLQQAIADRPWLDPDASPQIVIDGVSKSFGDVTAVDAVSLKIYRGEMFALVGGSGCGKTTLLRMLAGFAQPGAGRITIDGADMTAVPPHARPVNMMFQSYALFPHMSVEKNVGYGLRRLKIAAPEHKQRVEEALEMVQLGAHGKRKPHQLSGGQRQRVALARALIRRPKVLLLDEPLSALDKKLREQTQFELMGIQSKVGITFVIVTHDQEEAMALSTRIAVMDHGRVIQVGTPAEVYEFPHNRFVANFIGTTNLFEATITDCSPGRITVRCAEMDADFVVDDRGRFSLGQRVCLAVRPEKIRLSKTPSLEPRMNCLRGVVAELGYLGNHSVYRVKTPAGKLIIVSAPNMRRTADWSIDWSDEVYASWSADACVLLTG